MRPIAIANWEIYDSAKGIGLGYKVVVVCNNAVAANPPPVWVPPESGTNLLQSAPRASKIFTTLPRFLLGVLFILLLLRDQLSRLFGAAAIASRE